MSVWRNEEPDDFLSIKGLRLDLRSCGLNMTWLWPFFGFKNLMSFYTLSGL